MHGVLVGAPEPRGPWRDSCLRLGFLTKPKTNTTTAKNTKFLLVVCFQNAPTDSSSLRPNNFVFRTFSSHPVTLDPKHHILNITS